MKKNKLKIVLSIVLATVMVAGTITYSPLGTSEVQAASATVKNINLGTGGLANSGSKVYFGLDTSSTVPKVNGIDNTEGTGDYTSKTTANNLWRVLDASTGLLLADDIIAERRYDYSSNAWDTTNELYNWLNGTTYKNNNSKFSALEQGAIATNSNGDMRLLTIDEVKKTEYGFTNDEDSNTARAASSWWWLRSPGDDAPYVLGDGSVFSYGLRVFSDYGSVRPAFNLNLSSVLFSSASSAGKSSFASVGTDEVSTNTWKLTLKDNSKTVYVSNGQSVSQSGQTVTVPYTYTGDDVSQISIMITDKAYTESDANILYYGALDTTLATTGTGTFTLPGGLSDGYKIYMMAEDVNEATLTDYSSTPVEINPTPGNCVIITNPEESHITLSTATGNGSATQTGLTGAMADVSYTADNGYCFPSNYSVASQYGIDVTRIDDSTIKVSGTPTANTTITLEPASQKTYTITSDIEDKDFGTKNAGYTQPSAQTVTITNTGNQSVTISKNALTNYTVSDFSKTTLAANETATFTVKPKANLAAGTYNETITVSTANSTSVSIPVIFKVNGAFGVTMNPSSSTIIDGESQTLTATPVGGSGSYTYKWYKGSETSPINGETSASINVSPSATTTYKVVVNDTIEDTEVTATITVNPKSYTITSDIASKDFGTKNAGYTQPSAQTVTITNTGNQSVTISKNALTNYTVSDFSKTTLAANETATFTVKPKANLAAGTYNETITVSTANSTSVSIPVIFKVNGAFGVTMNPSSSTIIDGESQTLTATPVGGSGSYTYKWYKGSETSPINGETSASINVSPSATTTYKVVVNDTIEDTEVTATITVNPKSYTITSDIASKDFGTKNAGYTQPSAQTVTITNTGNQSVTISKNALTNYTVSDFSKTTLAANETATFTVKPKANLAAGTYNETITVSTANSTSVSIPVIFKVNGAFGVTMNPSSSTIIDGESQTLTATPVGGSGSYTYKWYKGSETSPINGETSASINVSPSATTTYKVVVNDTIEDTEVTATITVNPMTYTVTYDKNGGSGVMTAGTATKDTAFTLPSCGFTAPEGKQFKNWAIGSVSGTTVAAGATYTFTGATTVYAIWENIPVEGPTIVGDNGTTGWDAIKDKTENATAGSTITVDMNGTTKVPGAVIDSIKGKDVDVVFDLGNGIKWTVNGKSVTKDDIGEIDFGVTTGTNTIPVDVVNEVTGEKYSIQISLAYNGEFGFTATLSISMDAKNAGYYANLYYYNKSTGKLEFMNAGKIDKNGNVDLTFTHASDYTIVVSDKAMNETDTSTPETPSTTPTETESAKTGDHSPILLWVIVMMASGIGITVASRKRKKAIR